MKNNTKGLEYYLSNALNNLAYQDREKKLREYAKKASPKTLRQYISNKTNDEWTMECSVAKDELIRRGIRPY